MAKRRDRPCTTSDQLLRKIPGYKPPVPKEGEEVTEIQPAKMRESLIYDIGDIDQMVGRTDADESRQE